MGKFKELLEELDGLNILQTESDWAENLPEEIWEEYFKGNFKEVASGLNVETHRWYERSTSVVVIYGRFIGITFITNMFSESQEYEDCAVKILFCEMEKVSVVSYKPI